MPRDWDAAAYDRLPIPMTAWGESVVEWLDLSGDERVLDAGCGTGKVTELLRRRLPRGTIVALDGSPSMIERARARLGVNRIEYVVADLEGPLPIVEPVDAILSTATLHWIDDHDALFGHLSAVLRPGGRLAAQCGGAGNIASVEQAVKLAGHEDPGRTHFAEPERTAARLGAAGFIDVECWLHAEPTAVPVPDLEPYLETICLGGIVEAMDEDQRRAFVHEVASRMPRPVIDYVRLNIRARRAFAAAVP